MYIIHGPIQIKEGFAEKFIEALLLDAKGSVENEPGCLRFDVIRDESDPNRIYLYEVYKDEEAFKYHTTTPHIKKWQETVKDWWEEPKLTIGKGINVWPTDEDWE